MSNLILNKKSVVFEGTSHDKDGLIILISNPDGVRIKKETDQGREDITLTVDEMKAILTLTRENFNQKES
jgi:hypothetical protein